MRVGRRAAVVAAFMFSLVAASSCVIRHHVADVRGLSERSLLDYFQSSAGYLKTQSFRLLYREVAARRKCQIPALT